MFTMRCKIISAQPHEGADFEYNWFVACCYANLQVAVEGGFYAKSTARHWQSRQISIAIGIGTKKRPRKLPLLHLNTDTQSGIWLFKTISAASISAGRKCQKLVVGCHYHVNRCQPSDLKAW
jgi:hypothetical protein